MFNNIHIATRLKILGAVMAVITLLLIAIGYSMVTRISSATSEMYTRGLVSTKLLAEANNTVWELRFGIANYTLATPENRKKILDARPQLYDLLEEHLKQYAAIGSLTEKDPALKELQETFRQYKAGVPKWFELIDADKLPEAAEYRAKVTNAAGSAMVKNIKALIEKQLKTNEELEKSARATAEHARNLFFAIGIAAFLIVVASVLLLGRAISRPLSQMQAEIEEVEKSSDFSRRVTVTGNHEIGQTAKSFNKLMSTMQTSLRQLLDNVDQVSKAVSTLSSSSDRLATGSAQQSEATDSIAATMEQITVSINHVSDSARDAMEISTASGELSSRGRDIIQKTVDEVLQIADTMRKTSSAIGDLGQQSNHISSVVQVIKEVADQTNLLALNAAIEAARAGEQGRGFAVVADEVRKLAERTTKSTIEITQMIGNIQNSSSLAVSSMSTAVTQMDGGVAMAQQASDAINLIKDRASEVTNVVNTIASALREQSSASNNIAAHVENVARMTEANSSATNEIASAIHDLEKLADAMRTVGHRFRI